MDDPWHQQGELRERRAHIGRDAPVQIQPRQQRGRVERGPTARHHSFRRSSQSSRRAARVHPSTRACTSKRVCTSTAPIYACDPPWESVPSANLITSEINISFLIL